MLIVAGTIWLVFLRPVPMLSAKGIITSKTYSPPTEYAQYQPGNRAGFRQPTKIPIADGYLVNIRVHEPLLKVALNLESQLSQTDWKKKPEGRY